MCIRDSGGRGAGQRHQPVRFRFSDPTGADPGAGLLCAGPAQITAGPLSLIHIFVRTSGIVTSSLTLMLFLSAIRK